MKVYWSREALMKHRRRCIINRDAYPKIVALGLDHTGKCNDNQISLLNLLSISKDSEAQEKLGIEYDYVPNPKRINKYEEVQLKT